MGGTRLRAPGSALISGLWGSIEEDWGRLRREVDLAIAGGSNGIDLRHALKIQTRLVESWERLTVAMERFVNAKYGGQARLRGSSPSLPKSGNPLPPARG